MKRLFRFLKKGIDTLIMRLRTQGLLTTAIWFYGRGLPFMTGVPVKRYSQVTPNIFVGAQFGPAGKSRLARWGISGAVNMRIEFDDLAHNLALERYCHLPTVDDQAPSLEHLEQGVQFIQQVVADGGKVYIHCAGGIGRAPTMAAAYFISQGLTLAEALALIKKARPFINIMPPQMAQLKRFEARHREKTGNIEEAQ